MDAIFDESFTSPLVLPDLPYQGAIRLRDVTNQIPNQDVLMEYTSDPTGKAESFPQDLGLPHPTRKQITADISDLVSRPKRGRRTHSDSAFNISVKDTHISDNETSTIHAYFTSMSRLQETINYAEYLNMAHEQHINNKNDEKIK